MGSEWENVILRDVTTLRNGAGVKQEYFSESGIPLVRVSDFTMNSIDIQNCNYVEKQHAKKWETHLLNEKDILVATVGSWPPNWSSVVGKVIRTPESARGAIQNQNTCCVVPIKEVLDNDYLYYRLKSEDFSWHTSNNAGGSANQARLPVKKLGEFTFLLPPLDYQKRIGSSLAILDNKIQLNRETNQTLEAMAQALFKSWFVDFDPVFDNIIAHNLAHNNAPLHNIPEPLLPHAQRRLNVHNEGQNNADNVERGSARQTAAHAFHHLFPQAFEQSDEPSVGIQGWIPKGWGAGLTSEIATTNEISWTKKSAPLSVDYVDLANAKNGRIQETTSYSYDEAPSRAKRCLSIGDTIIGLVRPGNRSFAYISVSGLTGSTGFAVMRPKDINLQAYLYFHLTRDDVIDEFARLADGAAYPAIRPEVVSNLECIVPPAELLHEFQQVAGHLLEKIGFNVEEVKVLESLRDTLLPKLISGELRIPDAEQATEALAK